MHPLGHGTKQKSAKNTLKSRNQITVEHAHENGLCYLAFQHRFNELEIF